MTAALTVAVTLVVAYGVLALLLWRYQERIVFQPPQWPEEPGNDAPRLSFSAPDGTALFAYVVGVPRAHRPPVLAFHGNAVVARAMIPWTREAARRLDTCVVLAEYRGYDGVPGSPTYAATAMDAQATLEAASAHLGVPASSFILFGHSLGSAVAAELAASAGAKVLVLESPFTSARDMVARWPVVGVRVGWHLVSRVHYDTVARVRDLDVPVFVAHGERDVVVPPRMGRRVFAAAKVPGQLLMVPGAGHSDVPDVGGENYWRWLATAMKE
jgi:pimeloyl-ACP methyl ester carboxylesterase